MNEKTEGKKRFINPFTDFKDEDFPIFVFSDDMRGFMGWLIKSHSKGNWNHAMIITKKGYFATQTNYYKEVPIITYIKPHIRLKFWKYRNLPKDTKDLIKQKVQADLNAVWWKRRYDYLGIIGQALGIRWLNSPVRKYCSERVASYVRLLPMKIKKHPTPSEINDLFIKDRKNMELIGYYQED